MPNLTQRELEVTESRRRVATESEATGRAAELARYAAKVPSPVAQALLTHHDYLVSGHKRDSGSAEHSAVGRVTAQHYRHATRLAMLDALASFQESVAYALGIPYSAKPEGLTDPPEFQILRELVGFHSDRLQCI